MNQYFDISCLVLMFPMANKRHFVTPSLIHKKFDNTTSLVFINTIFTDFESEQCLVLYLKYKTVIFLFKKAFFVK